MAGAERQKKEKHILGKQRKTLSLFMIDADIIQVERGRSPMAAELTAKKKKKKEPKKEPLFIAGFG